MATYTLSPVWGAGAQLFDDNGDPLSGAKLYVYSAGTTTFATTYTDPFGGVPNTNPIIADAAGRLPNEIWFATGAAYKFVLKNANDVLIDTYDNIPSRPQPAITNDAASISFNSGYIVNAGSFTVGATYEIYSVGSTSFTSIGAAANTTGVQFVATGPGSGTGSAYFIRSVQNKLLDSVSIKDFGAVGDGVADDTAALRAAVASGGRAVFFPKGTYIINFVNLPSNTMLWGEGASSIITMPPSVRCAIGADSGSPTSFIENITIKNLRLEGRVVQDGFVEQQHISSWNGVKNLLIDSCQFIGFQGDGVYVGKNNTGAPPFLHNQNVIIRDCFFDGLNKNNRQGVSVIDCDGLLIEGCYFTRTTRPNMPGAIDVEPDGDLGTIIRDIKIVNNKFYDIGGNVGAISIFIPNANLYTTAVQGFLISGNYIENTARTGIFYYPLIAAGATNAMPSQAVKIVNNVTLNTGRSFEIFNAISALVEGNQFIRGASSSLIGFTGSPAKSIDLTLRDNQFIESGYVDGDGLTIFNAERLTLDGNLFKDCGVPVGANGDAINFSTNSSSSYVKLINNTITSPNGKTLVAIQKEATHTFAPETNSFRNNTLTVGGNAFQSYDNDAQETSYNPIITGSSTDGVGTYTLQYGRWRKIGKIVFFRLKVSVSAGHTGTGMIQVSLPTLATSAANNEETTVAVSATGVSTTGGQIGLINPGVDVGGVGAIRMYHTATGSLNQTIIPAGAFTITASGFYQEA